MNETLIVFDEVQMYPQARGLIKYLVADGRYDYIETGSLLSIKQNILKDIVIPSEESPFWNLSPSTLRSFFGAWTKRDWPISFRISLTR